jgi:regulation of enolase protein 1 (concanavalin A-like superfamily)
MLSLFLLAATAAATAEANVIQDALDKDPQSPPWAWIREEREQHRVGPDGKLQIRALRGTLWTADRNDARNLLVRPWPEAAREDAIVTVTVSFAPERGGEQAGVMLYFGDDDYIKIVRESLEGKRWIVMAREEKGTPTPLDKVEEAANDVTLTLERRGELIEGFYAVDRAGAGAGSDQRKRVGRGDLPRATGAAAELKICLFAHGGPRDAAEARWATFSNLKVTPIGKK